MSSGSAGGPLCPSHTVAQGRRALPASPMLPCSLPVAAAATGGQTCAGGSCDGVEGAEGLGTGGTEGLSLPDRGDHTWGLLGCATFFPYWVGRSFFGVSSPWGLHCLEKSMTLGVHHFGISITSRVIPQALHCLGWGFLHCLHFPSPQSLHHLKVSILLGCP